MKRDPLAAAPPPAELLSRPYRAQLFNRRLLLSTSDPARAGIVIYLTFLYLSLIGNYNVKGVINATPDCHSIHSDCGVPF